MSKRAEELAGALCVYYDPPVQRRDFAVKNAAALIDAELRKKRERCADRAEGELSWRNENDETIAKTRAAIIDDEEE